MRAIALAALLAACGSVHFTDPNAPQLFRSKAQYTTGATAEPVVWLPVIDVFAESSADCDGARAWTLQTIRRAMLAADPAGRELAGADLSPTCVQAPDRSLDLTALRQQIQSAVVALPSAHVRVAVVYANNIVLPLPGRIVDVLQTLRSSGFLWTLARPAVLSELTPDQNVEWTYTYDPALQQQFAAAVAKDFPLQSDTGVDSGLLPILGSADLPKAREAKVCSATDGVSLFQLTRDGASHSISASQPPLFRKQFDQRYGVPRSQFAVQTAEVEVEGCSANCGRFFSGSPGDLRRWNTTPGCFLGGP
jgi:hypothetical protein